MLIECILILEGAGTRSVMDLSLSAVDAKRCVTEAAEAVTASLGSARLSLTSSGMSE